jgi:PIN domain nuclease of toxin-antitoxin system
MEIMYLSERKRININLEETLNQISINSGYKIIDLNIEIIKTASKIDFYELHDRMILASAIWMGIPIISSDSLFDNIKEVEVIWD